MWLDSKVIYTVLNMVNNEQYVYHVTQLQPFHHDPRRLNPYDVALHDTMAYNVELSYVMRVQRIIEVT